MFLVLVYNALRTNRFFSQFLAGDPVTLVKEVDYFMSEDMSNGIYDSCKNVFNPMTSSPAIETICGFWGKYCDPQKLFDFVGDANAFSPFQINYKISNQPEIDGYYYTILFNRKRKIFI